MNERRVPDDLVDFGDLDRVIAEQGLVQGFLVLLQVIHSRFSRLFLDLSMPVLSVYILVLFARQLALYGNDEERDQKVRLPKVSEMQALRVRTHFQLANAFNDLTVPAFSPSFAFHQLIFRFRFLAHETRGSVPAFDRLCRFLLSFDLFCDLLDTQLLAVNLNVVNELVLLAFVVLDKVSDSSKLWLHFVELRFLLLYLTGLLSDFSTYLIQVMLLVETKEIVNFLRKLVESLLVIDKRMKFIRKAVFGVLRALQKGLQIVFCGSNPRRKVCKLVFDLEDG